MPACEFQSPAIKSDALQLFHTHPQPPLLSLQPLYIKGISALALSTGIEMSHMHTNPRIVD